MKLSLTEKAKAIKKGRMVAGVSDGERMELAMAYIRQELSLTQIAKAVWPGQTGHAGLNVYSLVCSGLKEAYRLGKIKFV